MTVDAHLDVIAHMISTVATDRRDEWPSKHKSYVKGESLSNGYFGAVRFAECRDSAFGFDGLEVRRCVVKTVYLKRRFAAILPDEKSLLATSACSNLTTSSSSLRLPNAQTITPEERLFRLYRRIVMELYVLNRCRHENIMHAHATFLSDSDLHIVLPRLYVLDNLIQMFRIRNDGEPISIEIIAKIVRQLCSGLEYLRKVGIIHRDVQPQNIYMTRAGTIKLGHFGQSTALFDGECKTPVGKKEFMCCEKLHNIYRATSIKECLGYSYSSDIWSLGVLILAMISYFPNERGHKLSEDFAMFMQDEKIPFIWLTAEMLQLRARIVKSGGEDLKRLLSDHLLTVSAEERATAASLPLTLQMQKWLCETVDEDKNYLRKHFINAVDFVNRFKLEYGAPNYECLETKDIPAEFYWNSTWQSLEHCRFLVKLRYPTSETSEIWFKFADPEPLFQFFYGEFVDEHIDLVDLIPLDYETKELIYTIVEGVNSKSPQLRHRDKRVRLLGKPTTYLDLHCELL